MKQKKLEILNKIILIFLLVQPLFDIYMAVVGEKLDVLGISIATIIRTIIIVVLFGVVIVYQIKDKVHMKLLYLISGYLVFVLLYVVGHHLNIVYSDGYYITEGIYNVIKEILYVERLVIPTLLLYTVIIIKPDKEKLQKAMVFVALTISLVIIITNIFKVSFASYSEIANTNNLITYNAFDWFEEGDIPYKESLSKGFFVSANQIGALLVILLPVTIYRMIKNNKIYLYFTFFLQIIALTLIGTRVASLGWMLVCFAMSIIYIVLLCMKKIRKLTLQNICTIVVIIEAGALLYLHSPAHNRDFADTYQDMYQEEISEKEDGEYVELSEFMKILNSDENMKQYIGKDASSEGLRYDAVCKYIKENHRYHGITKKYIYKIYPYQDDPEFWINMFLQPASVKGDNRERQIEIVKRIKTNNNNNFCDTLVGMGATPMNSREYMIENDIISHYYNLGVLGIITFVAPFVTCLLYVIIKMRKNLMKLFNVQFMALSLTLCIAYFLGFFAGHVLDEYIITLYLAPIAATIFNLYKEGDLN